METEDISFIGASSTEGINYAILLARHGAALNDEVSSLQNSADELSDERRALYSKSKNLDSLLQTSASRHGIVLGQIERNIQNLGLRVSAAEALVTSSKKCVSQSKIMAESLSIDTAARLALLNIISETDKAGRSLLASWRALSTDTEMVAATITSLTARVQEKEAALEALQQQAASTSSASRAHELSISKANAALTDLTFSLEVDRRVGDAEAQAWRDEEERLAEETKAFTQDRAAAASRALAASVRQRDLRDEVAFMAACTAESKAAEMAARAKEQALEAQTVASEAETRATEEARGETEMATERLLRDTAAGTEAAGAALASLAARHAESAAAAASASAHLRTLTASLERARAERARDEALVQDASALLQGKEAERASAAARLSTLVTVGEGSVLCPDPSTLSAALCGAWAAYIGGMQVRHDAGGESGDALPSEEMWMAAGHQELALALSPSSPGSDPALPMPAALSLLDRMRMLRLSLSAMLAQAAQPAGLSLVGDAHTQGTFLHARARVVTAAAESSALLASAREDTRLAAAAAAAASAAHEQAMAAAQDLAANDKASVDMAAAALLERSNASVTAREEEEERRMSREVEQAEAELVLAEKAMAAAYAAQVQAEERLKAASDGISVKTGPSPALLACRAAAAAFSLERKRQARSTGTGLKEGHSDSKKGLHVSFQQPALGSPIPIPMSAPTTDQEVQELVKAGTAKAQAADKVKQTVKGRSKSAPAPPDPTAVGRKRAKAADESASSFLQMS